MSKTTEIIIKMEEAKDRGDQATIDRLEAKYPGFFGKPAAEELSNELHPLFKDITSSILGVSHD
jgi:hypothetical protein